MGEAARLHVTDHHTTSIEVGQWRRLLRTLVA
jgi:hypothetical protein